MLDLWGKRSRRKLGEVLGKQGPRFGTSAEAKLAGGLAVQGALAQGARGAGHGGQDGGKVADRFAAAAGTCEKFGTQKREFAAAGETLKIALEQDSEGVAGSMECHEGIHTGGAGFLGQDTGRMGGLVGIEKAQGFQRATAAAELDQGLTEQTCLAGERRDGRGLGGAGDGRDSGGAG